MAENTEQMVEQAKRLHGCMEWLATTLTEHRTAGDKVSAIKDKLDVFEEIIQSFETVVGGRRAQLERREEAVGRREASVEDREASVENHERLQNALMVRSERLLEGEETLRQDRDSVEKREAALEMAQSVLRYERNNIEQERLELRNEWGSVEIAKVNLECEMENLTFTTGEALSELKDSKDQLQSLWQRDVQAHSDRVENLSRELEAAKEGARAANKVAEEALEAKRREEQRASSFENTARQVTEAKDLVCIELSAATNKIAELEAMLAKATLDSKSLLEQAQEATSKEEKRANSLENAARELEEAKAFGAKASVEAELAFERSSLADKSAALAVVEEERDGLSSRVQVLESTVKSLEEKVATLEQAKIQLKTQMDKVLPAVATEAADKPKRARKEEPIARLSSWHTAVDNAGAFLRICQPEMDPDGSCTEEQVMEPMVRAAVKEESRKNLMEFFESSPRDSWCCFEGVVGSGRFKDVTSIVVSRPGGYSLRYPVVRYTPYLASLTSSSLPLCSKVYALGVVSWLSLDLYKDLDSTPFQA
ncbi:hypothetical protein F5Y00DRAFT_268564 [Daldinia vernicosa]|uniref:uncharacterized protein n=1 Tax=Daldinia vernicosa TaxID=114800 RepID=UPI00200810A5|nr:uncharacterized protein F5Y00DRAFT_268564 [Daldinia vernicosa]KAI0850461.1 hypothetical protein F5Y00DRAFT_268564 [Daldinia vernicosa]